MASEMLEPGIPQVRGHQTLQEVVYDTLRRSILEGTLKPGQRLQQNELAAQLGVSTMPVREALRRLEAEGLVTMQPRRGAVIAELHIEEIEEIYLIRSTLESLATSLAVPNLQPSDIAELRRLFDAMEAARQASDYATFLGLDGEFHSSLYHSSGTPLLNEMIATLWDRSRAYRQVRVHLPRGVDQPQQEHAAILDACERGDAEEAARLVRENLDHGAHAVVSELRRSSMISV